MTARHGMSQKEIDAVRERYGVGPHVSVDLVVFSIRWKGVEPEPVVLFIRRKNPPYQGSYALPGGFVDLDEDLETAARRELAEETGLTDLGSALIEQLQTFGAPDRDPRSRVISVVHLALVPWNDLQSPEAGDDAAAAEFLVLRNGAPTDLTGNLVELAFDHADVLREAQTRIQLLSRYSSAPLRLLPPTFPLARVDALHALLAGDKSSAAPRALREGWLAAAGDEYRIDGISVRWTTNHL